LLYGFWKALADAAWNANTAAPSRCSAMNHFKAEEPRQHAQGWKKSISHRLEMLQIF
jgi:hypothetical protein